MVATSQGPQTLLSRPFKDSRYSCPWSGAASIARSSHQSDLTAVGHGHRRDELPFWAT